MSDAFIDSCITGMLLGDAYIDKTGRFGFNHSSKQQEYFNHKVSLLRKEFKVGVGSYKVAAHKLENRTIHETQMLSAYCSRAFCWKELRNKWYPDGKKIVPSDISITPVTLAYWYMDDGTANLRNKYISYYKDKKYVYIGKPFIQQFRLYTDGFDAGSQDILISKLSELGVVAWRHTRKTGHSYLVISKLDSRIKFKELVSPIVSSVPAMLYKVDKELTFQQERISEKAPEIQDDALFRTEEN